MWKFPYITDENGGAIFVLVYLFFLIMLGIPVMTMEFAVGRASQKSLERVTKYMMIALPVIIFILFAVGIYNFFKLAKQHPGS